MTKPRIEWALANVLRRFEHLSEKTYEEYRDLTWSSLNTLLEMYKDDLQNGSYSGIYNLALVCLAGMTQADEKPSVCDAAESAFRVMSYYADVTEDMIIGAYDVGPVLTVKSALHSLNSNDDDIDAICATTLMMLMIQLTQHGVCIDAYTSIKATIGLRRSE